MTTSSTDDRNASLGQADAGDAALAPPAFVRVLGVRVDDVTQAETLTRIAAWVAARTPRHVVTVNPEFVVRTWENEAFAAVLDRADLATPDGVGVVWAGRRLGATMPERVGGSDIAVPLAEQCARLGHRLFLLGAAEGVAAEAARRLQQAYPELLVVGTYAGSPRLEDEEAIVEMVTRARPDLLLVAYGSPAQDFWIARNKERLGVPVSIGVGGALDYLAGVQRRAPAIVRRLWLDWAFRLLMQPWRWRRMLALPRFAWAVLRHT